MTVQLRQRKMARQGDGLERSVRIFVVCTNGRADVAFVREIDAVSEVDRLGHGKSKYHSVELVGNSDSMLTSPSFGGHHGRQRGG